MNEIYSAFLRIYFPRQNILFDFFICSISCRRQLYFNLTQISQIILFRLDQIFLLFFHWRGISGWKDAHQSHFIGKLVYQGNETNGHPGTSRHPLQYVFIFFVFVNEISSAFPPNLLSSSKYLVWFFYLLDFSPKAIPCYSIFKREASLRAERSFSLSFSFKPFRPPRVTSYTRLHTQCHTFHNGLQSTSLG